MKVHISSNYKCKFTSVIKLHFKFDGVSFNKIQTNTLIKILRILIGHELQCIENILVYG